MFTKYGRECERDPNSQGFSVERERERWWVLHAPVMVRVGLGNGILSTEIGILVSDLPQMILCWITNQALIIIIRILLFSI